MTSIKGLIVTSVVAASSITVHYSIRALDYLDRAAIRLASEQAAQAESTIAEMRGFKKVEAQEGKPDPRALCALEATRRNVNPAMVCALIQEESAFNQFAISNKGAIGLGQIMPFNKRRCSDCGVNVDNDLLDVRKNVCCTAKIIGEELVTYDWDPNKAIQAYNGGPKCVGRCAESIEHARKVLRTASRDTRS